MSRGICHKPKKEVLALSPMSKGKEIDGIEPWPEPQPEPQAMSREQWAHAPKPGYRRPSREPWDLLEPKKEVLDLSPMTKGKEIGSIEP